MIIIQSPQTNGLRGLILGPENQEEEKLCEKLAKRARESLEYKAQKISKVLRRLKRERLASKMERMDKLVELVRDEQTVRPYPENSIEDDAAKKIRNTRPPSTYKKVCAPENQNDNK
jgi:hypothetical protein